MLADLAFVPPNRVPAELKHIREQAPPDLIDSFDTAYVRGVFRVTSSAGVAETLTTTLRRRRVELPPEVWNVLEATLNN